MDRLQPFIAEFKGGLVLNRDLIAQGDELPGTLTESVNFEPSLWGGYRRISGYQPLPAGAVPNMVDEGGEPVESAALAPNLGAAVELGYILTARADYIYATDLVSTSWQMLNPNAPITGSTRVRFNSYDWMGERRVGIASGVTKPMYWNTAGEAVVLDGAPDRVRWMEDFHSHMFVLTDNLSVVTFSAPINDNDYTPASGAGEINVGRPITALRKFRDALYIFCEDAIFKLVGQNSTNFQLEHVTDRMGCRFPDTIVELGGDLLYLSDDGVRTVAGTERIGDVELATISKPVQGYVRELIRGQEYIGGVVIRNKSQYRLYVGNSQYPAGATNGLIGAIRDADIGWEWGKLRGVRASSVASGYIGSEEVVVHGGYSCGCIYRHEVGNTFSNIDGDRIINATLKTPLYSFGDPTLRKVIHKGTIHGLLEGPTEIVLSVELDGRSRHVHQPKDKFLSVGGGGVFWDYTDSIYDTSVYGVEPEPIFGTNLEGSAKIFSIILNSSGGPSYTVRMLALEFIPLGRK